ncbi:MAG: HAMP domain-containing protein [Dehalococcoidales bacterium]
MLSIRNMTLQGRIGLLVLGGLAVGLGLFSWLGVRSVNESIDRTLDERLTMARMMASQVDGMLNYALVELSNAAVIGAELFVDERFDATARSLRATLDQLGIAGENVILTGADGATVLVHPPGLKITAAEMLAQPTTREVLDSGVAAISGLVSGPVSATPMVLISVPVADDGGGIIGVLTCAIDIRQSSAFPGEAIALGRTGYAEIIDGNGLVLARTEPGSPPDALERSDHPDRFAALIAGGTATTGTCHRCHETAGEAVERRRDVLAFAPLSVTSWGVVIRQPEEEALAPTAQLGQRLIIVGIVVVAGTLLLVGAMIRGIVRPVRLLTAAAAKVAAGDFSVEIPVKRRDEIGQLSSAFRSMTEKLAASRDELVLRNEELRMYGAYVVRVHEDERQRLARELHDVTIQELMLLCHRLDDVERDAAALPPEVTDGLREARSTAEEVVKDMRDFARSLRPPTLDDLGMVTSIRRLLRDLEERSEIRGRHKVVGEERRLPPDVELGMFRIAQEALRNVERHAEATRASVTVTFGKDDVKLEVRDNGTGFVADRASGESRRGTHLGLVSMQERAELLGGTLEVQSGPHSGTRVTASLPIPADDAAGDEPVAA